MNFERLKKKSRMFQHLRIILGVVWFWIKAFCNLFSNVFWGQFCFTFLCNELIFLCICLCLSLQLHISFCNHICFPVGGTIKLDSTFVLIMFFVTTKILKFNFREQNGDLTESVGSSRHCLYVTCRSWIRVVVANTNTYIRVGLYHIP